jgi:molecular chaperone GrpE
MSDGERFADFHRRSFEADARERASAEELSDEAQADLDDIEEAEVTDGEVVEPEAAGAARAEGDEIEVLRAERDEYLDALRRLQAEFDNYRKRTLRQQTDLLGRASESLIERLLPILDALDLAVAHSDEPDVNAEALIEALQQISALARDTLLKEGVERIDAAGVPFDPTVHDAVAHLPRAADDPDRGVVVDDVLRAGYQLKGRVLRPAMVRVRG